eukprot:TRINITY_DN3337_c0_g1_i2.p1 TRINITY_DN3337_c0_g1~~TRINITY_DN3337_c0_g1_i2.p1  ORF type:complete len:194 (+),score=59.09 TRINITY_DN3337_c0_g1_i2:235-816(+)
MAVEEGTTEKRSILSSIDGLLGGLLNLGGGNKVDTASPGAADAVDDADVPELLSGEVSSIDMRAGVQSGGGQYIMTMKVVAKPDSARQMAALLHRYLTDTNEAEVPQNVLNFVVNQDPSDPAYFQVIQRFPGPTGMVAHQSGASYSAFVRSAQPLLAESLGVYLCKESGGKIGQALYPWGPKGEGGRDDMVYR